MDDDLVTTEASITKLLSGLEPDQQRYLVECLDRLVRAMQHQPLALAAPLTPAAPLTRTWLHINRLMPGIGLATRLDQALTARKVRRLPCTGDCSIPTEHTTHGGAYTTYTHQIVVAHPWALPHEVGHWFNSFGGIMVCCYQLWQRQGRLANFALSEPAELELITAPGWSSFIQDLTQINLAAGMSPDGYGDDPDEVFARAFEVGLMQLSKAARERRPYRRPTIKNNPYYAFAADWERQHHQTWLNLVEWSMNRILFFCDMEAE